VQHIEEKAMNPVNFEKLNELVEPLKAMAELNVKTLQSLSYMKPEEFTQFKKPEEFLQKQVEIVMDNGHKLIDYVQQSFQLVEKSMLTMVKEIKVAKK
jgi:hypothetical protein